MSFEPAAAAHTCQQGAMGILEGELIRQHSRKLASPYPQRSAPAGEVFAKRVAEKPLKAGIAGGFNSLPDISLQT